MYEFLQSAQFFTAFSASDLTFLAEAAGRTLLISVLAISIGTVLGCVFGWVLSLSNWVGTVTLGFILDAFRSVPLIIQLILFFNLFPIIGYPLNPFAAGTFVLVLYTSALVIRPLMNRGKRRRSFMMKMTTPQKGSFGI